MKFKLKLKDYEIEEKGFEVVDKKRVVVDKLTPIDVRNELYAMLRLPGVYKDGVETCDGVALAAQIKTCKNPHLVIDDTQMNLLRRVMNKLIAKTHNPTAGSYSLGGERYIELIQCVFKAEEVKDV